MHAIRRIGVGVLGLLLAATAVAGDSIPGREFTATLEYRGPQGTRRIGASIVVDRYTPVEEARKLKAVLADYGQAGLAAALRGRGNGRLRLGALDYNLDLVVTKPTDDGWFRVIVITTRMLRVEETETGSESLDFPFGVIAMELDHSGRGSGAFHPRATLWITEDGSVAIEGWEGEGRVLEVKKVR
jgi:hypothetical protein